LVVCLEEQSFVIAKENTMRNLPGTWIPWTWTKRRRDRDNFSVTAIRGDVTWTIGKEIENPT